MKIGRWLWVAPFAAAALFVVAQSTGSESDLARLRKQLALKKQSLAKIQKEIRAIEVKIRAQKRRTLPTDVQATRSGYQPIVVMPVDEKIEMPEEPESLVASTDGSPPPDRRVVLDGTLLLHGNAMEETVFRVQVYGLERSNNNKLRLRELPRVPEQTVTIPAGDRIAEYRLEGSITPRQSRQFEEFFIFAWSDAGQYEGSARVDGVLR